MWKVCPHQQFLPFHQQRNAAILSIRKEVVPEAKGRHPAKDVKAVMDGKVRRSEPGVETGSSDT
jgi:hypothetical protein